MRTSIWLCIIGFFIGLAPAQLTAVKVKVVEKISFKDFQKGSFQHISIGSKGWLTLGPKFSKIPGPAEEFYFSLAAGKTGEIVIGTGHNAAVYRFNPEGMPELLYKGDQLDVYALLVASNGDIIAGTSPNGKLIRISAKDKTVTDIFDPTERFIWDLKEDSQGNIVCAMGNPGAVYSVSPAGQVDTLFTPEDAQVMCLYIARDGSILAGSGDRGILYQIKNRKIKVLYDSPLDEIRAISEDRDGNIYFSALKNIAVQRVSKDYEINTVFHRTIEESKKEIKEKSILYCLKNDGNTETLWSSEEEYIYSLQYDQSSNSVVMGTGNSGRIYRVNPNGDYSLFLEGDSAQVYKIAGTQSGFVAIANNAASVLRVENSLNSTGTYYSEVIDNLMQSRFGRLTWQAETSPQTSVQMSVRFGNSGNPDASWTDWSAPFTDPENSNLNVSGYRFLQIRVGLNSLNPTVAPRMNSFHLYYLESNREPQVREINVQKTPVQEKSNKKKDAGASSMKTLQARWLAEDPNKDSLLYHLFLKRVTDKNWMQIRKNLEEQEFILETETYEDGKYLLKVEADDVADNPPALAKKSSLISTPFIIDSTPPYMREWQRTGNTLRFTVADEASSVRQVLYSFDGKEWFPLFPEDLIADSRTEVVAATLPDIAKNSLIFIKIVDEFDNYRVYQKEL